MESSARTAMITRSTVKPAINAARGPIRLPQSKGLDAGGSDSVVGAGFFSGMSCVVSKSTEPHHYFIEWQSVDTSLRDSRVL